MILTFLLASCGWWSQPAPPTDDPRPDIVIITLDTTRADRLGMYGYPRPTSPNLDALATESIIFDRHIVPMATTLPTHLSLMTGVYPSEHGVLANVEHGGSRFLPGDGLVPLARGLKNEGYATAGFVAAAPLRQGTGIEAGFLHYTEPERVMRDASEVTRDALRWLESAPSKPILLWAHYYDPHNPWRPPEPHRSDLAFDPTLDAWLTERSFHRVASRPNGEQVRMRPANALYDAEIRYMDTWIGTLLDALRARPRWDNTLILVVGDHGEGLNQHGEPAHGRVWHEQLHAPWFMRVPGEAPRRVAHTVSTVDVLPTLAARLKWSPEWLAQVSGVDALAEGAKDRPVPSLTSDRQQKFGRVPETSLTDGAGKCVVPEEGEAVRFDHREDPYELKPIADEAAAACRGKVEVIAAAWAKRAAGFGAGKAVEVTEEEYEALRELGYVE